MPAEPCDKSGTRPDDGWYSFAIIRVVPWVERGEQLNVGVILFARTRGFLEARMAIDESRLRALAPDLDLAELRRRLDGFTRIGAGSADAGPIGQLSQSERFHWMTSPRSTVIQTSPVHVGVTDDPGATLEELLQRFVRPVRSP